MLDRYLIAFVIFFLYPLSLKADFKGLPDLPDIGEVNSYDDSVRMLFGDNLQKMQEITTSGGQVEIAFIVVYLDKKWFVKITREDCESCDTTHFETEWTLKKNHKKYFF